MVESVKTANMASVILGCAVVGLELGFLLAYRSGWNISSASLVSNTLVALLLIPIGLVMYKESITLNTMIGVFLKELSPGKVIVARMDDEPFKKKLGISDERYEEIKKALCRQ